jgi:antitoxin (DNA-binding transcriptional repressor) of toxin-antitoxin stability system
VKIVEKCDATGRLADYAAEIKLGPVVITDNGEPVAALVSLENTDLETIGVCTNAKFVTLIERSRAAVRSEGAVSEADMRRIAEAEGDREAGGQPPQ